MTPEEIKQQELKNNFDAISNQVTALSNAVNSLTQKLDSQSKDATPKNKFEGWGNSVAVIIGILSGIAVLFTQLKQPENIKADTEEKLAGARKSNAEALKMEHEIQVSLDSLKRKGSKDVEAYNDLIQNKLPKLENVIARFETAKSQNQKLLYKYIIIWVIFIGLGWFFRLFHTLWSNLLNLISFMMNNRIMSSKDEKKRLRLGRISNSVHLFYSVPTIVEVIIDINIFFVLIVPIFNETSASLGSNKTFKSVSSEFSRFHINSSIDSVRNIIAIDSASRP
jgi:hypothetical protein